MATTKDVLERHLKCFGEGNLTGILSDYAMDAVFFTPNGPLKAPTLSDRYSSNCLRSSENLGPRSP